MSIRDNPTYLNMTPLKMVEIIENPDDTSEEQDLCAWQWVYDTGIWKHMQGSYGRGLEYMLSLGVLEE